MDEEIYAVIDLKSFYASCECAARGLDIFATPLVVADKTRSVNSIVMSVTPFLKKNYGLSNVCRIGDIPNIPDLIYATPRMAYYVEMSAKVVSLFLDYVAEEDLHVYSIDESFIRLTPYLKLYGCDADTLVSRIQKGIFDQFHLVATAGMGPNMFLAKSCLDHEGKKKPPYRSYWGKEDVKAKLWSLPRITDFWGISHGIERRLYKIGIRSIEALAKADERLIKKELGVVGLELKDLANGIDRTDITKKYVPKDTSVSQCQVLMRDYTPMEARLLLKETVDDLCTRLRKADKTTSLVSVYAGYSSTVGGGGFQCSRSLNIPTDDNETLERTVLDIYDSANRHKAIRTIGISMGKLRDYHAPTQLSFLENDGVLREKRALRCAIDRISDTYGRNAVLRASSLLSSSTIRERHGYIGGHRA